MYVASDEVRLFSRLGYEDLGYETGNEFDAYIATLIPLAQGLVDQFCNVPEGFFEAAGYEESSGLYDYRETLIHLRYHPVLNVSKVEVNTTAYGSAANWVELTSTEYIFAKDRGLLKIAHDEILRLECIDIDSKHNVVTMNHPVKGHNAGQATVSTKLIAMLNTLPKTSERVFPTTLNSLFVTFIRVKQRAARRLQNLRLLKIRFTTFRHWGRTMLAYYTHGNVLKVKELLRHKSIQNTMKYIHMVHFKDPEEFEVASATTAEEVKQLATAGFEKVDEIHGIHVFRRPKRFRRC